MVSSIDKKLAGAEPDDAKTAAKALEAYFMRRLLSEVRGSTENSLDSGYAGSMFREMLDEALADKMSESGGVGIASVVEQSLTSDDKKPVSTSSAVSNFSTSTQFLPMQGLPTSLQSVSRLQSAYEGTASPLTKSPVKGQIATNFGMQPDPKDGYQRFNSGVDIAAPEGAKIASAGSGKIVRVGPLGDYGTVVVVDHGGGVETRYGHMGSVSVKVGDTVSAGDEIGSVGMTGRAVSPQLHFEVRRGGRAVDPINEFPALQELR